MFEPDALVAPANANSRPLCVDLDGTLVKTDTLIETLLSAVHNDVLIPLRLLSWLRNGKAAMKQQLAISNPLDPAMLPYNQSVLAFIGREKAAGRTIILVTAADRHVADAVATHLGIFDGVIASDGMKNLRGATKAAALVARFGRHGFDYLGNDSTDLKVWDEAATAIVVNAPARVRAEVLRRYEQPIQIDDRKPFARALLRSIRPHQWVKNVLVFVPLLAGGGVGSALLTGDVLLAFLAFCLTASSIYVCNDLMDLSADRHHPRKRFRPFAHGDLPLPVGVAMVPLLLASGLALGFAAGVLWLVAGYAIASTVYTFKLKELPLVDVFMLAAFYTVRIVAGGVASGFLVTLWLLGFSCFIFLGLGFIKRAAELQRPGGQPSSNRRGYKASDATIVPVMGIAATFASALMLTSYVQDLSHNTMYSNPVMLWFIVPLLLFWQCRLWLSTTRGYMNDDPIVYATKDWVSWCVAIAVSILFILARIVPPIQTGLFTLPS